MKLRTKGTAQRVLCARCRVLLGTGGALLLPVGAPIVRQTKRGDVIAYCSARCRDAHEAAAPAARPLPPP